MNLRQGIEEGKVEIIASQSPLRRNLNLFRIFFEYKVMETVNNDGRPDMEIPTYRTDMITVADVENRPYSNLEEALRFLYPDRDIVKAFTPIMVCECNDQPEERVIKTPI